MDRPATGLHDYQSTRPFSDTTVYSDHRSNSVLVSVHQTSKRDPLFEPISRQPSKSQFTYIEAVFAHWPPSSSRQRQVLSLNLEDVVVYEPMNSYTVPRGKSSSLQKPISIPVTVHHSQGCASACRQQQSRIQALHYTVDRPRMKPWDDPGARNHSARTPRLRRTDYLACEGPVIAG
ncbi:uncharacterized protein BDV17DRAFT_212243 [Aspergillus undulatus]|uniref:uncharacterized protein n=1 Tax=Aspergillus undulatus TaxID=1810928 RepID=UPI003CCCC4C2